MHVLYELRLEVNDDLELFAENKLIINFNPLSSNIMYNPKNLSRAYVYLQMDLLYHEKSKLRYRHQNELYTRISSISK